MEVGVGYPDTWTDYSSLKLATDTAYANKQAAEKLRYRRSSPRSASRSTAASGG